MTERQRAVFNEMKKGIWYTPKSLGTNERCLDGLRRLQLVKRRKGAMYDSDFTLNQRWEYTKI